MQTLYGLHFNMQNQISVDTFNDRRSAPNKWKVFFAVSPASVARLRRVYLKYPKRFMITKEWSPARWRAYKEWRKEWLLGGGGGRGLASLDNLETNSGGL